MKQKKAADTGIGGELHQSAAGKVHPHDPARYARFGRSELAAHRRPRPDRPRRLPFTRENLSFRPRAHPRASSSRSRLRRARVLRNVRIAKRRHEGRYLRTRGRTDARIRTLLDGRRKQGLGRSRARRPRFRRQALYEARQLGYRRQQHPGVTHPVELGSAAMVKGFIKACADLRLWKRK